MFSTDTAVTAAGSSGGSPPPGVDDELLALVGRVEPGDEVPPRVALLSLVISIGVAVATTLWWVGTH